MKSGSSSMNANAGTAIELQDEQEREQRERLGDEHRGAVDGREQEAVEAALLVVGDEQAVDAEDRGEQDGDRQDRRRPAGRRRRRVCREKWKTTSVVMENSAIAGTTWNVRSSRRSSLRSRAETARHMLAVQLPDLGAGDRRSAGASSSCLPPRRPSARSAPSRPPTGSWLVTTRVRPEAAPISGSTSCGGARVEVGGRLVEQQQLGVVQDRAGDRGALDHPARVGVDRVVAALASARRRPGPPRRARRATPCRRAWKRRFSRAVRSL